VTVSREAVGQAAVAQQVVIQARTAAGDARERDEEAGQGQDGSTKDKS
jgi:hypothetical protein